MKEEILRMEHIYLKKRGRYALQDFKLNIYRGELVIAFGFSGNGIHELGEVLSGSPVERGRILVKERELSIRRGFLPERHGIYVVHNENNLVPDLTVAENLFLGEQRNIFAMPVSRKKQERLAQDILDKFGLPVEARRKAREIDAYYYQMMIKLVKAYVKGASLVVINEILELPYITVRRQFFHVLRLLREDGVGVLWLSQRLEFVQEIAERIVVVRDGRNVKNFYGNQCSMKELIRTAGDNRISKVQKNVPVEFGAPVLTAVGLGGKKLTDADFSVKKKQIAGFWSGEAVTLESVCHILNGEQRPVSGQMWLADEGYCPADYEEAVRRGVRWIDFMWPERQYLPDMSVVDNILLANYWQTKHRLGLMNSRMHKFTETRYRDSHPDWPVEKWYQLTPDQQRLLLYERCLEQTGKLFLISEPFTRVSYYMMEEIIRIFREMQQAGKSLLLFSMNFWDLSQICDVIHIFQGGRLVRSATPAEYGNIDIWEYNVADMQHKMQQKGENV